MPSSKIAKALGCQYSKIINIKIKEAIFLFIETLESANEAMLRLTLLDV